MANIKQLLFNLFSWIVDLDNRDGQFFERNRGYTVTVTAIIAAACLPALFNPPGGLTTVSDIGVIASCNHRGDTKLNFTDICPGQSLLGIVYADKSFKFLSQIIKCFLLSIFIFAANLFGYPLNHRIPVYIMNMLILYTLSNISEAMLMVVQLLTSTKVFNNIMQDISIYLLAWATLEWTIGVLLTIRLFYWVLASLLNWDANENPPKNNIRI